MFIRYELHNHSTESDAIITVKQLLDHMEKSGTDVFAITDHNTMSGHHKLKELLESGNYRVKAIYGMEYTTYYGHLLCPNLKDYVSWESIDKTCPERLFKAVREKGCIAGMAHPFSYGAPFARGCRWEMQVSDWSVVDFIEIINNPEPLHEVNERGLALWKKLVLSGETIAATAGMDLHTLADMEGRYATYIEGDLKKDVDKQLTDAVHHMKTCVTRGVVFTADADYKKNKLNLILHDTVKKGYKMLPESSYSVKISTPAETVVYRLSEGTSFDMSKLSDTKTIICELYETDNQIMENLIAVAPVVRK